VGYALMKKVQPRLVCPQHDRCESPACGELIGDPQVTLTGIPEADALGHRIEDIAYDAAMGAFGSMPRQRRRDPEAVGEAVRRAIRAALSTTWNKKPTCHVHVLEV